MARTHPAALVAVALLLTAAAVPALAGCSRPSRTQVFSGDQPTAETTTSAAATAAADSGGATARSGVSGAGSGSSRSGASAGASAGKLTSKEAGSLDAELSAIQNELDRLSLPSDKDFDSIESGLE